MSLQYEEKTSVSVIQNTFSGSTFSDTTKNSLYDLLTQAAGGGNGDDPGVQVGNGSVGGDGQITTPDSQFKNMVVVNIPTGSGSGSQTLTIPDELRETPVWVFDTDVDLSITFNTVPRVILTGRGSDNITVNGDANTTIESAGGNDTLTTSGGDDLITVQAGGNSSVSTGAGNDTIRAGTGNDTIDAGTGIDVVGYSNSSAGYTITYTADQLEVESSDGSEILMNVERLHFSDKKLALDLQVGENAAMSLQIINVIAAELRDDPEIVGMILEMFDSGYTLETLAQHAIDVGWVTQFAGTATDEDLARIAYANTFGAEPDEAQLDWALSFMDGRVASYTQAEFIVAAAQIDENNDTIDLVGLQQTGVEYLG